MIRCAHIVLVAVLLVMLGSCAGNNRKTTEGGESQVPEKITAVVIDTTHAGLRIYFPQFSSVGLVTGEMPDTTVNAVIFCCAAAFTGQCMDDFKHSNVAGDHVSDGMGKRFRGFRCARNNGAFVYYKNHWKFLHKNYSAELDSAAVYVGSGFAQEMMIHEGIEVPHTRKAGSENLFRALCEIDGQLCVADAKEWGTFGSFINNLLDAGATEALYLDMGSGWNHSWYRSEFSSGYSSPAIIIHPKRHEYCTNWLTFWIGEPSHSL